MTGVTPSDRDAHSTETSAGEWVAFERLLIALVVAITGSLPSALYRLFDDAPEGSGYQLPTDLAQLSHLEERSGPVPRHRGSR